LLGSLLLCSGITRNRVGLEELNVEAISRSNSLVSSRQSSFSSTNRFPQTRARVGTALLTVLLSLGIELIEADGCFFNSDCGGCRSIYLSVGSGDRFDTQQGPTLLYEPQQADFKWGRVCELFTP